MTDAMSMTDATRRNAGRPSKHLARRLAGRLAACVALAAFAGTVPFGVAPAHAQDGARAHYRALPVEAVRSIESDLIWAGATDAVSNGRIGRRDIAAIREFEEANGLRADGVLDRRERRFLARRAEQLRASVGYDLVDDPVTGVRLGLPRALVEEREGTDVRSLWSAPSGEPRLDVLAYRMPGKDLQTAYREQVDLPIREVTYEVLRDDFFVVAGTQNGLDVYFRGETNGREVRAFAVVHDPGLDGVARRMITAMSSDFEPFAGNPRPARTPARTPAGTSTGASDRVCGDRYSVRPGDTFYAIALRCAVSVPALSRANPNVDPLSLRVGQALALPRSTGAFPPAPRDPAPRPPAPRPPVVASVSASLLSAPPRVEGAVDVRATGFRPGDVVEAGFGRTPDRFVVTRIARADERGRVTLTMRLPSGYGAGETAVAAFATPDGTRGAATEPFTVRPPRAPEPPPRNSLTLTGMLTTEGEHCMALRTDDGRLFTLAGRLPDYAPGTPVRVEALEGTRAQARRCGQGTTIEVEAMARR